MLELTMAVAITPIAVISTESGGWAASACAALAPGAARSLITAPSPNGRKIDEGEQEQPADDCHVLQAGR